MATTAGASKRTARNNRRRKPKRRIKTKTQKTIFIKPQIPQHKHLSDLIPLLVTTASAAHTFLLRHDLKLLPAQTLALESLISSTARSITNLTSLISFPLTTIPHTKTLVHEQNWFDRFNSSSPDYDPRWIQFFNMSKNSFTLLLRLLTPSLTSSFNTLPPNVALAATLFRLSHAASFSAISRRFCIDSATACRAFYSVCKSIVENLGHLFEFGSDINRIIVGFGWISLPNCCGVLGIEKFELEGDSNLLVQGLVDSEGRFLDLSAGWPGCQKPQEVLKKSKLFSGVEESNEYLNGPAFELSVEDSIPQYILGDSCYPLLPWLLTPFSENGELSSSELAFNEVHCRGMELVESAFRRVKKRWKLVGKKWNEQCVEAFPFVIVACCLLHNFTIKCSEIVADENLESLRERKFAVFDGEESENGKRIRDSLASHLSRLSQRS